MRGTTIARSYAEALFELGERHGESDAYGVWLDALARMIESTPQLRAFLETPKVGSEDKRRTLREAFGGRVPPRLLNFLLVVIDKRRQGLFPEMAAQYHALLDRHKGRLHAEVTLAHAPTADDERRVAEQLSRSLGKTVIPHVRVNPDILGGVIVRYGDKVLDGSLRRQLLALRHRMLEAELPRPAAIGSTAAIGD